LSPRSVRSMFASIEGTNVNNSMTFGIFAALFRLFRFFSKYSIEKAAILNASEFNQLINDP